MSPISDIYLITQVVVCNNTRAFDSLVRKYQSPVRRFFLHQTLGDKALSDDLSQETFIKAYLKLSSFKSLSNFQTWLFRIAYNVFYDYLRAQKETASLDDCGTIDNYKTQQPDIGCQMDVYRALEQLKPDERACITLFYLEEQPIKKVAQITGLPEGTIKSHLSRGRRKMAEYLKNNGYNG